MSIVSSTPAQIANSPLNNSRSKMLYSFPRAKRLPDLKVSSCAQAFYELPAARSTRSASFGYGHKFDFTKGHENQPAPNAYSLRTESGSPGKTGFSFGLSREAMKVTGSQFIGEKNSPGPGAYDTRESNKIKIAFTFRPRPHTDDKAEALKTPGPGTYQVPPSISKNGKYFLSKYKGSGANIISPARSHRFISFKEGEKPGPGAYETKVGFAPNGSYFVSKFKSSLGKTFGSMSRNSSTRKIETTPGPGSYRLPSDFGYYESASLHKSISEARM
jgi:hypothetical protein